MGNPPLPMFSVILHMFLVMLMTSNYLEFNGFARFMCTLSFRVGPNA